MASVLRRFKPSNIVLDPVLVSSSRFTFLDHSGTEALIAELLPLVDLVTPNLDEAAVLSGITVANTEQMRVAAGIIQSKGAKAVLVKGGHLAGDPQDLLLDRDGSAEFGKSQPRIDTPNTHGTGCFLSSMIAGCLAVSCSIPNAVQNARILLVHGLGHATATGGSMGYPNVAGNTDHFVLQMVRRRAWENKLRGIYVVLTPPANGRRSVTDIANAAYAGGACAVQFRDKVSTDAQALAAAKVLRTQALFHDSLFLVNDRLDLALAVRADGVHLGPDDLPAKNARRVLGREPLERDVLIGVSVNSVAEAEAAAKSASYFGVGAIYGSKTKLDAGEPVGLQPIQTIKSRFPKHPIVAIGGINTRNLLEVRDAGADCAAVSSAVCTAEDPEAATRELVDLWYS